MMKTTLKRWRTEAVLEQHTGTCVWQELSVRPDIWYFLGVTSADVHWAQHASLQSSTSTTSGALSACQMRWLLHCNRIVSPDASDLIALRRLYLSYFHRRLSALCQTHLWRSSQARWLTEFLKQPGYLHMFHTQIQSSFQELWGDKLKTITAAKNTTNQNLADRGTNCIH